MTFNDEHAVEQVASLPAMKTAVRSGTDLTELWPLTTAERMDNDAKYAENLQVRLTLTMRACSSAPRRSRSPTPNSYTRRGCDSGSPPGSRRRASRCQ